MDRRLNIAIFALAFLVLVQLIGRVSHRPGNRDVLLYSTFNDNMLYHRAYYNHY